MAGLPLVGDEFASYRVRSVLGRGGMSVVYQAENLRLSSVIALKVLAPELADDDIFRARFLEESRIAASLNHPNVIPIYDMGAQDNLLYIAMRYVSGTDMRQMIKKRGRILPATALFLVGQAARALDAAHRRGLVHRDVKPGNLLIERGSDDADPDHVYLADFGITKHAMSRSGLTSTGQFLGTIDYVAPEQIRGTSVLGQADQYSLGCVLYECLTGRVPFEKDLDAAIIWAHVEETPTMPTVLRPELPPEIDEVFGRVLAKRPDERYGSCREFVEAARMALGILGPGTESAYAYGVTADPQTRPRGITPVSRPSVPPDQFSWSGRISQPSAPDPVAPGARPHGTLTSHRREQSAPDQGGPGPRDQQAGATPPPSAGPGEPRWYRRPRWIAALAAVVLILAGVGTWAGLSGSGSHKNVAAPSMSPKPKPKTNALMAALHVQARRLHRGDLHRPGARHHRGRLPDLPEPAGAVHRVHGQGRLAQHREPVQAELQGLRIPGHLRRDRLEPPVPAHQQVHRRPDDHRERHRRPGRGPRVLQLHPGPGVHGLDPERRPPAGLRGRPGAHRRVELVGRRPPQHRHRRLADEHADAGHVPVRDRLAVRDRHVAVDVPVRVHERDGRLIRPGVARYACWLRRMESSSARTLSASGWPSWSKMASACCSASRAWS
jgi:serine/threonine protein kinase